ncbi:hypothetical protein BD769DRAFT_1383089 [Suillus cothurnatus]|nr:hypothetical protein BD769DRAFT_1383089 [Suillus cothurnatus]
MSFHSASSQHENSDHDGLQNEVGPTTHDQLEPNGSNLKHRSGHGPAPIEHTTSIRSNSSQCEDGPGDREVHDKVERTSGYPSSMSTHIASSQREISSREALLEHAISFLERTTSLRSFSYFESDAHGALYYEAEQKTEGLAPYFKAVIVTTVQKTAFVALLLIVAFSVKDSRLLRLTDHLVFAVESGVRVLVGTYLGQRGIEEREVLRCMGVTVSQIKLHMGKRNRGLKDLDLGYIYIIIHSANKILAPP